MALDRNAISGSEIRFAAMGWLEFAKPICGICLAGSGPGRETGVAKAGVSIYVDRGIDLLQMFNWEQPTLGGLESDDFL